MMERDHAHARRVVPMRTRPAERRWDRATPGGRAAGLDGQNSGACMGSIVPSPRITFLNCARDTET